MFDYKPVHRSFYIFTDTNKLHDRSLEKESKRLTVFQILHCITCINLSLCQRQFLNPCFRTKIYFLQVQPKHIRCQSRFEIIHFILLIGNGTPTGRRNIRLLRRVNTKWYRNITHHTQYTGNCNFCISSLRNGMNVERSPDKAVTRTICSR